MVKVKRIICASLIFSSLLFPASAFASTGNNSHNNNNNNSSSVQSFSQILSSFFGSKGDKGNKNDKDNSFWGKGTSFNDWCNDKDFKDWYDKNKNNCPPIDSYDIWQNWFCK